MHARNLWKQLLANLLFYVCWIFFVWLSLLPAKTFSGVVALLSDHVWMFCVVEVALLSDHVWRFCVVGAGNWGCHLLFFGYGVTIPAGCLFFLPANRQSARHWDHILVQWALVVRPPDKSAYWKTIFFISHPKHMLWVLKRTVSMRRFFWAPKTHVQIDR